MATRKEIQQQKEAALQTKKEVWGVALIALGVFLAVCQYVEGLGIVGAAITGVLFGLFGLFAYAMPPVLAVGGILLIANALNKPRKGRTALVFLGIVCVVALIHVIARPVVQNATFFVYMKDAYTLGTSAAQGGGAIGALFSYFMLKLLGEIGAYIFLIAGLIITILLVTRISLRETGRQVKTKVQESFQQANERSEKRRQQLYTGTLEEEPEFVAVVPQKRRPKQAAPRPATLQSGQPMATFTIDGEDDISFQPEKKAGRPSRQSRMNPNMDGVSFLPTEGPIQKKPLTEQPGELPVSPVKETEMEAGLDGVHITYYEETKPAGDAGGFLSMPAASTIKNSKPGPVKVQVEEAPLDEPQGERKPYVFPSFSLLNPPHVSYGRTMESPTEKGKILIDTLESFNVKARIVNISVGPVITRFELAPAPGVRVNKITVLSDDIALALAAPRVRIEAPIPGKAAVGIEVPNKDSVTVVLRDIVESKEFQQAKSPITLALGKDIAGKIIVADLAKMPHLLIAGATGSGKSVCINDIIISLIYKCSPDDLQLILVDPKVVELSAFGILPHLKVPVVTDPKKAAGALAGGVREMTERYQKFAKAGARDLARYNELQTDPAQRLPKLVIIIDELADLMMVAPDTVEDSICRIAQLGRAAGIHLIVATQRPSADVITGLIKANIPSRIAFAVASAIDSRIILDSGGAEKLLGRGDMLFQPNGGGKPIRAQGAFVSDEEVERIVQHFQAQELAPTFDETLIEQIDTELNAEATQGNGKKEDELLGEAVRIVLDSGQASISMIQRRLRVGYARAARLVDMMEQEGFVSGFDGSKPRRVLISRLQYEQIFGTLSGMEAPDAQEDAYDEEE